MMTETEWDRIQDAVRFGPKTPADNHLPISVEALARKVLELEKRIRAIEVDRIRY